MRRSKPLRRAVAVSLSVLLALLGCEIFARIFYHDVADQRMYPRIYRSSDILPWELLPRAKDVAIRVDIDEPEFHSDVEINSLGYRGREFDQRKPPGTYRVLFLGDSMVFGLGVQADEGVTQVLERLLQQRLPTKKVEVINAGFASGYSADTYYVYLKTKGLLLDPDMVISSFLPRNDLADILYTSDPMQYAEGRLPERVTSSTEYVDKDHRRRTSFPTVRSRMRRYSRFWDWAADRFHTVFPAFRDKPDGYPQLVFMEQPYTREYEKAWLGVRNCMAASSHLLHSFNPRVGYLVVVIPDSLQVHRETWDTLKIPFQPVLFEAEYPQKRFASIAQEEGFESLDLLPEMRERGKSQRLFFRYDGHLNARGHRAMAEIIDRFLAGQGRLTSAGD